MIREPLSQPLADPVNSHGTTVTRPRPVTCDVGVESAGREHRDGIGYRPQGPDDVTISGQLEG
jgi:hypothetical protein